MHTYYLESDRYFHKLTRFVIPTNLFIRPDCQSMQTHVMHTDVYIYV